MRRLLLVAIIVGFIGAIGLGLIFANSSDNKPSATINGQRLNLEVIASPEAQAKGLSGREAIGEDEGMLFVFQDTSEHCMWMKDMRFSIDMIWLDGTKRVVHMAKNVSPRTYPKNFCSQWPSKYVLETAAGKSEELGLRRGQQVQLEL